jgi:hypothetical protein
MREGVAKKKHQQKASAMSAGSAEGLFMVRIGGMWDKIWPFCHLAVVYSVSLVAW